MRSHPQSSLNTPKEGEAQPQGVGAAGTGLQGPDPTLIRQIARRHLSPGSSFEGWCQEGDPGAPRLMGWRGWATDLRLWPVLPGTCQTLEEGETGWGWALRLAWRKGWRAGPTTFTGDAPGLLRITALRKQKEAEVSAWGPCRQGGAQAAGPEASGRRLCAGPGSAPQPHPFLCQAPWVSPAFSGPLSSAW